MKGFILTGTMAQVMARLNYLAKRHGSRTLGQIVAEGSLTGIRKGQA